MVLIGDAWVSSISIMWELTRQLILIPCLQRFDSLCSSLLPLLGMAQLFPIGLLLSIVREAAFV